MTARTFPTFSGSYLCMNTHSVPDEQQDSLAEVLSTYTFTAQDTPTNTFLQKRLYNDGQGPYFLQELARDICAQTCVCALNNPAPFPALIRVFTPRIDCDDNSDNSPYAQLLEVFNSQGGDWLKADNAQQPELFMYFPLKRQADVQEDEFSDLLGRLRDNFANLFVGRVMMTAAETILNKVPITYTSDGEIYG